METKSKKALLVSVIATVVIVSVLDTKIPFLYDLLLKSNRQTTTTIFLLIITIPSVFLISKNFLEKNKYYYCSIWWLIGMFFYRINVRYWDFSGYGQAKSIFSAIMLAAMCSGLGYLYYIYFKKSKRRK